MVVVGGCMTKRPRGRCSVSIEEGKSGPLCPELELKAGGSERGQRGQVLRAENNRMKPN